MLLLGSPGVGKGTQADILAALWGIPKISTGDILRANVSKGTALGVQASDVMRRGDLVPDHLITEMVADRLSASDTVRGFILDGFPRTIQQALWLGDYLAISRWNGRLAIVSMQMDSPKIIERIVNRRICPTCKTTYNIHSMPPKLEGRCDRDGSVLIQRNDDKIDVIEQRFEVFRQETEPLIKHYQDHPVFMEVCADRPTSVVTEEIITGIELRSKFNSGKGDDSAS